MVSKLEATIATDIAARRQYDDETMITAENWNGIRARLVEDHQRENQALDDRLAAMRADTVARDNTIKELTIGQAFGSSSFIGETVFTPAKARKLYGDHFDIEEGQIIPFDAFRGAPDRSPLTDGMGEPISLDAALRRLVTSDPETPPTPSLDTQRQQGRRH